LAPKLGEILVEDGACTPAAVRDALKNQVIFGGRLGTNLLEIHGVAEDALARALGRQHRLPALFGPMRLDPRATALLKPEIADRYDAIPYALADRRLALVVADPNDLAMLDEVAFATGKQVYPLVAPEARLWALLRETYGIDRHLRGIDVDFAKLTAAPRPAAEHGRGAAQDLMDEGAFDALYAGAAAPRPATTTPTPTPTMPPSPLAPAGGACRGEGGRPASSPTPTGTATPTPAAPDTDSVIELTDLLEDAPPPAPPAPPPVAPPDLAAQVLAALSGGAGHAPPARLVRPARPPEPEPSPLGFDEAVRFLEGVTERDSIAKTVLRYARSRFARAVLFTVHRGAAHGWAGLGERLGREAVRHVHLALGTPGILDTVVRAQAHFLGPIPKTEANIRLLRAIGGGVPANALVVPILALGRVVNVLYADGGKGRSVDAGGVGELLILATRIAKSYDALIDRVR
jgi:hypothetical protein